MRQCPKCGSPRIHRSRSRGPLEQIRKTITSKRLHRCHSCGWRGWGVETEEPAQPGPPGAVRPSPDLKVIDAVVIGPGKNDAGETDGGGRHRGRRHRRSMSHL